MRFALISDIHANLEAMEAVLHDIEQRRVEKIHCLGDVVGYGCDPVTCLQLVDNHCEIKLIGNHEFSLLGRMSRGSLNPLATSAMDWTTKHVTDREFSIVAGFVMDSVFENCYLVHASPYDPSDWHYILTTTEAELGFTHFEQQLGFMGHTHLPMIFSRSDDGTVRSKAGHDFDPDEETRYLINIGAVGQPRDNDPRACYVIVDSDEQTVSYHRVMYDLKTTQAKMAQANMPKMLIERLEVGR
jgi:predicted phosphodiesterase